MKRTIAAAVTLFCIVEILFANDLSAYKSTYEKERRSIVDEYERKLAELGDQYIEALDALLEKAKRAGDLDMTVAVMNEIKRFKADAKMPERPSATEAVLSLQSLYKERAAALQTESAAKTFQLFTQYERALERLQVALVKSGELDQAKATKEERNRAESSRDIRDAKARLEAAALSDAVGTENSPLTPTGKPDSQQIKWDFDGTTLDAWKMGGRGSFAEQDGRLTVASYGKGKDWHGPEASIPVPVSFRGDFHFETDLDYVSGPGQLGRLTVGIKLRSGKEYKVIVSDSHANTVEYAVTFSCNSTKLWGSGIRYSSGLPQHSLGFERKGKTMRVLVNGEQMAIEDDCDNANVKEVFLSIEQYAQYAPLQVAAIKGISLKQLAE